MIVIPISFIIFRLFYIRLRLPSKQFQNLFFFSSSWHTGLENWEYGWTDPSRWPRGTIYPQRSALTSPTSDGRSVGIVRSRTQAREFLV
jgi:hypothetical protein